MADQNPTPAEPDLEDLDSPEKLGEAAENTDAAGPEAPYRHTVRGTAFNTGPVSPDFRDSVEAQASEEELIQSHTARIPEEVPGEPERGESEG